MSPVTFPGEPSPKASLHLEEVSTLVRRFVARSSRRKSKTSPLAFLAAMFADANNWVHMMTTIIAMMLPIFLQGISYCWEI